MKDKFDKIIKELIETILKENGFKKKGLNFYRMTDDTQQILNVQKSRGNSSDDITFYINCGILINDLLDEKRQLKTESESDINKRIRDISDKIDLDGMTLNSSIDFKTLFDDISSAIEKDVIPWFNNLTETEKAVSYMITNNGLFKSSELLTYLSKNKKKELIIEYIRNVRQLLLESDGEARIPKFFERFLKVITDNNYAETEIREELKINNAGNTL